MKYALILLFALINSAFACEVYLPYQLLVFNEQPASKDLYQIKNCDAKVSEDLHHIITGLEGRVASFQLKEMLTSRGHNAEVNPQSILIQQFRTLVRDQLLLPAGVQVKSTQALNMNGAIAIPAGDRIEITCQGCLYGTQQPLNVAINGFDGSKQTFIVTADFKKMVKAYRLISPLPSFSSVADLSLLKEEYVESIPHTDLITDIETLKFYKTNKLIRAGELLKKSDLNAINLVKAGLKTDVVLENQVIRIKTQGISRGNGTFGELVEVYHPQKNKKYQGKVIDINKVLVEL